MEALLPSDFGYVIFVIVASIFMLIWMGMNVGSARKKYDVKYPAMYSDKHDIFNCIQRAHQNTIENYPQFLILLIIGGLMYPRLNAAAGVVFLLGRIFYAKGYYTGDPAKRQQGAFGYLGLLTMLGTTVTVALKLLGFL